MGADPTLPASVRDATLKPALALANASDSRVVSARSARTDPIFGTARYLSASAVGRPETRGPRPATGAPQASSCLGMACNLSIIRNTSPGSTWKPFAAGLPMTVPYAIPSSRVHS